jgi:putative inorganic carbon (HCO3(-)) transporter
MQAADLPPHRAGVTGMRRASACPICFGGGAVKKLWNPSSEKPKDAFAFGALVAFVVVAFTVPAEWIPGMQLVRPALLTSGLAAGATFLGFLGRRERIHVDGIKGMSIALLAVLAYLSASWSVYPEASTGLALELLKLVAIYFTFVNIVSTERRAITIVIALVLSSIVASVGVIQWHQAGVDLVEGYRARWVGVFADPNIMAKNLGLIVPLALALVVRKTSPWWLKAGGAVAAGLAVTSIVLSHSRGGFIGLSLAVLIWVIRERNWLRTSLVAAAAIGMLVFAPSSFWNRTESVSSYQTDASAMGRIHAWTVTGEINKDRPLLGVGAGAFRFAWPLYAPPDARRAYMAHNVFLQVLAELGLVGFVLFLLFVGSTTGGAFEAGKDSKLGWMARAVSASAVGYIVCDLFAGEITSTHAFLLFGLASSVARLVATEKASAPAPQPVPSMVMPTLAAGLERS